MIRRKVLEFVISVADEFRRGVREIPMPEEIQMEFRCSRATSYRLWKDLREILGDDVTPPRQRRTRDAALNRFLADGWGRQVARAEEQRRRYA